jgi:hypothetical protein
VTESAAVAFPTFVADAVSILLLQRPAKTGLALKIWSIVALASLVGASYVALRPGHMQDFEEVRSWLEYWNYSERNPYLTTFIDVDYPPIAFVVLSPIGLFDFGTARVLFLAANLLLTTFTVWLFVQWVSEELRVRTDARAVFALAAVVLATNNIRVALWLGQTVAIAVLLGVLAMKYRERRPVVAGLCLALSAFKPHLAIGFGLALLLTRRFRALFFSAAFALGLWTLVAWTLGETPFALARDYLAKLDEMYARQRHVASATSTREFFDLALGAAGVWGQVVYSTIALSAVVWLSLRAAPSPDRPARILIACLAWSLTAFPHQRHSIMIVAPVWWTLMWTDVNIGLTRQVRLWLAGGVIAYSVLDIPLVMRITGGYIASQAALGTSDPWVTWLIYVSYYPSRVLVLLLFVVALVSLNAARDRTRAAVHG